MDNLLAIDCATDNCSIALAQSNNLVKSASTAPRSNARLLLPMIESLMGKQHLSLAELDGLCVTNGPGSFTGIRIGVALTQGLAYAAKLPVFTFSTLELLAYHASLNHPLCDTTGSGKSFTIIPALDARMNEIYWAAYTVNSENGQLQSAVQPRLSSLTAFATQVNEIGTPETRIGVGHAYKLPELELDLFTDVDGQILPGAEYMITLLRSGQYFREALSYPGDLQPLYLRNEVSWKKRIRIRDQ